MHKPIKRWLLQGLIITLPLVVTCVVVYYSVVYTDAALWFVWDKLPWDIIPWKIRKPEFPGLGLVAVTTFLVLVGALTESWLVNRLLEVFNAFVKKVPIIRSIYTTVAQVAHSTIGNKANFSNVVLFEYPRKGVKTIGFKTSNCHLPGFTDHVNIFYPTTPNPTSGFYLIVPKEDVIETKMTPEEAFKLIISAGIVQD